mmetsp:Transcript_12951/g.19518  ORF Transcript_12951/g.19518 Transcript_12951/m.19518 type:complete len:799 (-) Transcript_12951:36-2432(-)
MELEDESIVKLLKIDQDDVPLEKKEEAMRKDVQRSLGILNVDGLEVSVDKEKSPRRLRSPSALSPHMRRAQESSFLNFQFSSQAKWEQQRETFYKKRLQTVRRRERDVESLEEALELREQAVQHMESEVSKDMQSLNASMIALAEQKDAIGLAMQEALKSLQEETEAMEEDEQHLETLALTTQNAQKSLEDLFLSSSISRQSSLDLLEAYAACFPRVSVACQTDLEFDVELKKLHDERSLLDVREDVMELLSSKISEDNHTSHEWRKALFDLLDVQERADVALKEENEQLRSKLLHLTKDTLQVDDVQELSFEKMKKESDELAALKAFVVTQTEELEDVKQTLYEREATLETLQASLQEKTTALSTKEDMLSSSSASLVTQQEDFHRRLGAFEQQKEAFEASQREFEIKKKAFAHEQSINQDALLAQKKALAAEAATIEASLRSLKRRSYLSEIEKLTTLDVQPVVVDNSLESLMESLCNDHPSLKDPLHHFYDCCLAKMASFSSTMTSLSSTKESLALSLADSSKQVEEQKQAILLLKERLASVQQRADAQLATSMDLQERLSKKDVALSTQLEKVSLLRSQLDDSLEHSSTLSANLQKANDVSKMKAELAKKQADVVQQQLALVAKMASLSKEKLVVSKREGRVLHQQSQLDEANRRLLSREASLSRAKQQLEAREASLASQLSIMSAKRKHHVAVEASLSSKDALLSSRQDQLEDLSSSLSAKEKQLMLSASHLASKKEALSAKEHELVAREAAFDLSSSLDSFFERQESSLLASCSSISSQLSPLRPSSSSQKS